MRLNDEVDTPTCRTPRRCVAQPAAAATTSAATGGCRANTPVSTCTSVTGCWPAPACKQIPRLRYGIQQNEASFNTLFQPLTPKYDTGLAIHVCYISAGAKCSPGHQNSQPSRRCRGWRAAAGPAADPCNARARCETRTRVCLSRSVTLAAYLVTCWSSRMPSTCSPLQQPRNAAMLSVDGLAD